MDTIINDIKNNATKLKKILIVNRNKLVLPKKIEKNFIFFRKKLVSSYYIDKIIKNKTKLNLTQIIHKRLIGYNFL